MIMTPDECRRRREALRLTPERLSELAGLAYRTVGVFERCATSPRHGTRTAILRALRAAEAAETRSGRREA
jgi:predicted transcriptional regulator